MTLNKQQASRPFGSYQLPAVLAALMRAAQSQPDNWLGRRKALILRKIALTFYRGDKVDAELDGIKIRFHLRDNVSERKYLFTPQFFDVAERSLMADVLGENSVFVDIGANAGIYTLTAAKHLGKTATCLSIEPNPVVTKRLTQNLSFNDFSCQIHILPVGVSDRTGSFTLHLDDTNLGGSSLMPGHGADQKSIKIDCYPLYDLIKDAGLDRIDVLKIDIEGAEEKALRPFFIDAPQSLWPRYMIIENSVNQWESGLIEWLTANIRGYTHIQTTRMNIILSRS